MTKKFYLTTLFIIVIFVTTLFMVGCTKQNRVFRWGGSDTIILQPNQKLVNITWKESNAWFLTKPMTTTDSCETYIFYESSNMGMFEGTVIIKEVKK